MRVRMKVGLSGPAYCLNPGDEREFPDAEALRLIAADFAVAVDVLATRETTLLPAIDIERRSGKRKARGDAQRED